MTSDCLFAVRYSLKPVMKAFASSLAGSDSSKKVERTMPSAEEPAFSMMVEFSQVSPAAIRDSMPSSRACLMISGAVVMEDGAKMMSGFAALMFVRTALKSVWFVWNCSSSTTVPPSFSNAVLKKEPKPEE